MCRSFANIKMNVNRTVKNKMLYNIYTFTSDKNAFCSFNIFICSHYSDESVHSQSACGKANARMPLGGGDSQVLCTGQYRNISEQKKITSK